MRAALADRQLGWKSRGVSSLLPVWRLPCVKRICILGCQTDYISLQVDDVTRVAALLENMRITNFSVLDKEFIHIYDSDISGKALSKAIIENGIGLESMGRKQDTLEDFFFQLTEEEK